jgi:hypothetical protein
VAFGGHSSEPYLRNSTDTTSSVQVPTMGMYDTTTEFSLMWLRYLERPGDSVVQLVFSRDGQILMVHFQTYPQLILFLYPETLQVISARTYYNDMADRWTQHRSIILDNPLGGNYNAII